MLDKKEKKDTSIIPPGPYCYTHIDNIFCICPYWEMRPDKEYQENGYCHFMEKGDWDFEDMSLLFDQCKECGINLDEENDI